MSCCALLQPQMAKSPVALLQLKLPVSSSSSTFPPSSPSSCSSPTVGSSPKSGLSRGLKSDHDSGAAAAAAASPKSGVGSIARSVLKRKRPPKLSIPALEGCFHVEDCIKQEVEMRGQSGQNFGMACKKGRRRVMEDTFAAVPNVPGDSDSSQASFYGVFDGHGGQEAAEFAAQNLLRNILDSGKQPDRLGPEATRIGYHTTDCHFLRQGLSSGASCLSAGIAKGRLVVANAGDCRAVLVKSDGAAVQLTRDHRLTSPAERRRVESLGGVVDCYTGTWRVQGVLAVSRGIGDRDLKQFISCDPDVFTLHLTTDCRYLILASDGLWDMVSNQEAVNCVLEVLRKESNLVSQRNLSTASSSSSVLVSACKQLVELSLQRGCLDDITVLIVDLRDFSAD